MLKRGLAKKLFTDAYQRSPWSFVEEYTASHWPFLDFLLVQKRLSYLDYVLTHRLLRDYPEVGEEVALFLCHITLAAKEGHLCVRITEQDLNPSVMQLWQNEEGQTLNFEEAQQLTHLILEGAQRIPCGLITTLNKQMVSDPYTPICRERNDFYLQRNWIFETLFLKFLKKHLQIPPTLTLDSASVQQTIADLCHEKILLEEQGQAILQSCLNPLTLITGGPGTGKTYTAGYLIKIFWSQLSAEQKQNCQIVLTAPTGKAAANLQQSLSRVASNLEAFPVIQAKTLHTLLEMKPSSHNERSVRLNADLIIVDESSMIDMRMMACLFESLKSGSRLILLGDQHQLPSVEAGSVFVDLIHLQQAYPKFSFPCTQLTTCLRAELKSLIDFSQLINQGQAQEVLSYLNQSSGVGVKRFHLPLDKKDAQRDLLAHALKFFPSYFRIQPKENELIDLFHTIRLLSPLRKGPFGVEALNQLIWQHISQKAPVAGWLAIPIMIVSNDYHQDLFNGETGVLLRKLPLQPIGMEDYAFFPSRQAEGEVRRLPALLLPKYEYAYCLSIHKSQGSEFDHVILVLPEGSELFGREVFYTAVTRARKQIEIYGSDVVILKTVAQQGIRLSGIEQRLTTQDWLKE